MCRLIRLKNDWVVGVTVDIAVPVTVRFADQRYTAIDGVGVPDHDHQESGPSRAILDLVLAHF